jgi:RNA polymerase sigma factor (TIGR02999 family)
VTPAELLPQVYDELRRLASAKLAVERDGHTLDATALVHEAWLKLGVDRDFATKADYLQAAAQAMRRILVDHARARNTIKRNAIQRVELESHHLAELPQGDHIEALDDAITLLANERPAVAQLVELKQFVGLTLAECASVLNISERTADSWWAYARAWLGVQLNDRY